MGQLRITRNGPDRAWSHEKTNIKSKIYFNICIFFSSFFQFQIATIQRFLTYNDLRSYLSQQTFYQYNWTEVVRLCSSLDSSKFHGARLHVPGQSSVLQHLSLCFSLNQFFYYSFFKFYFYAISSGSVLSVILMKKISINYTHKISSNEKKC